MKLVVSISCIVMLFSLTGSSAIRKDERVIDKELSQKEHELHGEHNSDYDHEAFLGEEAHDFDELSPDESKSRLAKIVDKIDSDNDKFVTEAEMIKWIKYIQRSYVTEDSKHQWEFYDKQNEDSLTWSEYVDRNYGGAQGDGQDENDVDKDTDMKERDKRRFDAADGDKDGKLSLTEFVDFLHPEDAEHMRDIVITETMEDIDKDKDGVINEKEYIGDMWTEEGEEPDWVKTEREHFQKWRDLNSDGVMDKEEVRHWIMPDDYDHAQAESRHLIYEADKDKDGKLTKDEILEKYDLFVGSQATDFGEALNEDRTHDEF